MILTRDGKEVIAIYKQDGDEVDEVKDANGRLVYTNTREITGTLPLSFTSRGKPLTDYRISGNTVQDGTPAPDAPVDVVGCGVRTEQLFEDKIIGCSIDGAGRFITNPDFDMYIAKVEQGVTYTASSPITGGFFYNKARNWQCKPQWTALCF